MRREIPGFLWNRVRLVMLREMLHFVGIGTADPLELDSLVQTRWCGPSPQQSHVNDRNLDAVFPTRGLPPGLI